jgi:hypothetical protein
MPQQPASGAFSLRISRIRPSLIMAAPQPTRGCWDESFSRTARPLLSIRPGFGHYGPDILVTIRQAGR